MKKIILIVTLIFFTLTFLLPDLFSQFFDMKFVKVIGKLSPQKAQSGATIEIVINVAIEPEFHINSHQPTEEYLIPTILKFEPIDNASFDKIIYPEPKMASFSFSEEKLSVYEGEITFYTKLTLTDKFPLGTSVIKGTLSYQACNDQNCFAPTEEKFELPFEVINSARVAPGEIKEVEFKQLPQPTEPVEQEITAAKFTAEELRAKQIIARGLPYAIMAFFIFGLALNLTPCVYPVIPITVGYFGGQHDQKKGTGLVMALCYVIGIAIIFAVLGLISGLAGKQWGFLFQNPWFVIIITTIILAMAASMFGAFEITIPNWLISSLGKSRQGNVGAFIMGLTVGVVIAPCAAGIIIGLVGLVAKLGIVTKGTLLFFIMGLGLGLPYLILATFSGLLNRLPQSGMWMVWVKKLFGILLIGVALYFFLPQAKHIYDQQGFYFGLLAIFGGLLLGFLDHAPGYTKGFKMGRGIFGVLLILLGIVLANHAIHAKPSALNWIYYDDQSFEELQASGKPIFIDFYADWCAPCKEMDRTTFKDERVIELSKQITMVKVDCTLPNENIKKFMRQFQVTGMPTLVFIDNNGKEIVEMRDLGYLGPDKFLEKVNRLIKYTLLKTG